MIRSLRRRFIFSAMAAFGILLLVLVLGITTVSILQVENNADAFMRSVLEENSPRNDNPVRRESPKRRMRPMENPIAYYDVRIAPDGAITQILEKGVWEPDLEAVRSYTAQAIASGSPEGRISAYKFRLHTFEDGSARLILMDNSPQMHMLANMIRTTLVLSVACLTFLFLILLPISSRVVRSYAQHIEKQKQFITNAGHEIKTPVAIIMSNVDAMELIQGENKWSRNIRSQTDRLSLLLQRLLFMARVDEASVVLPNETIDLNVLLKPELESYTAIIAERRLGLHCELCPDARVAGSRDYLQQCVHMLMDNAVQYANEGGEIRVRLEKKHRRLRMSISNTVEALPDCPPEALFDRFYRGDSARTQSSGGYGIGLSAARAIAEMHRGGITAEYTENNTICFAVDLPL